RKFDQFLLDKVADKITLTKGRCMEILRTTDELFVLKVISDGEEKEYTAKIIVGADGANSLVRKTFFPSQMIPQYVAIQQWIPYTGTQAPYYSCIFDPETSESCSWTIHKNGYLIYGGCFKKENCRKMFEKQKKRLAEFLDISFEKEEKTEACLVDRPHRLRDFVTGHDGVYLIGEAAGFISPSSFEGLSFAMKSGILLAESFTNRKEKDLAKTYHRKTLSLRFCLWLKMRKRWFMYTPKIRYLIMRSGLASVKMLTK
ncbi:MAG: FAD-dependent monooxygenase, partial [Lachnospiraceae bacterium]|nr:FAD-dependent monooxygenase [Lachnospiraceae bacterium]